MADIKSYKDLPKSLFWLRVFHLIPLPLFVLYFRIRRPGYDPKLIPFSKKPVIVVFNHTSLLDIPLASIAFGYRYSSQCYGIGKKELLENWRTAWLMRLTGMIPVDRENPDVNTIRLIMGAMRDNKTVLLAPEGTRSKTGQVGEFDPTFIRVAQQTGALIVPLGIKGALDALPPGATLPRPRQIILNKGEPIDLSTYPAEELKRKNYPVLAEAIRQQVIALRDEF